MSTIDHQAAAAALVRSFHSKHLGGGYVSFIRDPKTDTAGGLNESLPHPCEMMICLHSGESYAIDPTDEQISAIFPHMVIWRLCVIEATNGNREVQKPGFPHYAVPVII